MELLLDSDLAQAGGIASTTISFSMYVTELFSDMTFNDYAQAILTVGGMIYLFYRIKNSRLDAKIKEKQLKDKIKDKDI